MTGLMNRIRGVFRSPSPAKPSSNTPSTANSTSRKKSKSQGDLSYLSQSQIYAVREKDLQHKLHAASWKGDINKVIELCRPDKINVTDKEGRSVWKENVIYRLTFLNYVDFNFFKKNSTFIGHCKQSFGNCWTFAKRRSQNAMLRQR